MAVKKKSRTKSKAKKSHVGRNLLILGAVAGGAWAGWKFLIQPRLQAKAEAERLKKEADALAKGGEQAVNSAMNQLQNITPNTLPAVDQKKNRLSPIGTPYSKIDYNAKVYLGDKGAEVQFIQDALSQASILLNVGTGRTGTDSAYPTTDKDGKFGKKTYNLLKAWFTPEVRTKGVTPKLALEKLNYVKRRFPIDASTQNASGTIANEIANIPNFNFNN